MGLSDTLVRAGGGFLESRVSRRGFLVRAAVVGSALATSPLDFALRPISAYAAVCGSDSSCSSGYSVMCCTINQGINQCPPGTFAGGWWKADNAALCGGGARYYIDCQAECTGCSSGCDPFCDSGCWNYHCHCNDDPATCDNRLVACNVFRYGQCNQQIACSGSVVCRQISCRPPYEWLPCTTVAATDENTVDHSSECLAGWDAIQAHYDALGGPGSFLGASVGGEYAVAGGRGQNFLGGRIYGSASGAWSVHGAILTHYLGLGGPGSFLAFPVTDETKAPDGVGRFNHFTGGDGGSIYWTPSTGAWSVHGAIRQHWAAMGWERSVLGYPVTDEEGAADGVGRFNHFSSTRSLKDVDGSIYWTPATGAHEVHGPIRARWLAMGAEHSCLGYPVSDVETISGGQRSVFQHGTITYDAASGQTTSSC